MEAHEVNSLIICEDKNIDDVLDKMNDYNISIVDISSVAIELDQDTIYQFCRILIDDYNFYDIEHVMEYINKDSVYIFLSDCIRNVFKDTKVFYVNLKKINKKRQNKI